MSTFILALLTVMASPAETRPVRSFNLDTDHKAADEIVVGRVVGMRIAGITTWQKQKLEILELDIDVMRRFKGRPADRLTMKHKIPASKFALVINGYMGFQFELGQRYLLFLKKREDALFLIAPEGHNIARFPEPALDAVNTFGSSDSLIHRLQNLLVRRLEAAPTTMNEASLWLLAGSTEFKKRLAADKQLRRRIVEVASDIARRGRTGRIVNAASYLLSRLGETGIVDDLVTAILRTDVTPVLPPTQAMSMWFQGFEPAVQRRAFQAIAERAKAPYVVRSANQHLERLANK